MSCTSASLWGILALAMFFQPSWAQESSGVTVLTSSSAGILSESRRGDILRILVRVAANSTQGVATLQGRGFWSQATSFQGLSNDAGALELPIAADPVIIPNPSSLTLEIPANSMSMDSIYAFNLNASLVDQSGRVQGWRLETYLVRVQLENVISKISGGSRTVPVPFLSSAIVSFNGSSSTDPGGFPVSYQWTLVDTSAQSSPSSPAIVQVSTDTTQAVFNLNTADIQADRVYELRLTVTGTDEVLDSRNARTDTSSVNLTSIFGNAPIISVFNSRGETSINEGLSVGLTTSLDTSLAPRWNTQNITYQWTSLDSNLDLSSPNNVLSPINQPNLVISPSALQGSATYRIRVSASIIDATPVSAEAVFVINSGPIGGTCQSNPTRGLALQTVFTLGCSEWRDPEGNLPIRYTFEAQVGSSGTAFTVLSESQSVSTLTTVLPPAPSGAEGLNVRARISDGVGASTTFTMTVFVSIGVNVNISDLASTADSLVLNGDLITSSLLLTTASEALSSVSRASESQERGTVIKSLATYVTAVANTSSPPKIETSAALLDIASSAQDAKGLSNVTRSQTLEVGRKIVNAKGFDTSQSQKSLVGAMSNIISLVLNASVRTEQVIASHQVEGILQDIGTSLLTSAVTDQNPVTVKNKGVQVLAQRFAKPRGVTLRTSSGASATLPSDLGLANIDVVIFESTQQTFPGIVSSDTFTMQLRVLGERQVIPSPDGTGDYILVIPAPLPENPNEVNEVCQFWNQSCPNNFGCWMPTGLTFLGRTDIDNGSAVRCASSHLTAFTTRTETRVEVNNPEVDNISANTFSFNSPAMIMVYVMFIVFLLGLPLAYLYDHRNDGKKGVKKGDYVSEDFWRLVNRANLNIVGAERSWKTFGQMLWWSARSIHLWISVPTRHPGDYLNSWKRWTLLFTLLFNAACVASLLNGREQQLPFLSGQLSTALVAAALTFPLPFLSRLLFQREPPRMLELVLNKSDMSYLGAGFVQVLSFASAAPIRLGIARSSGKTPKKKNAGEGERDEQDTKGVGEERTGVDMRPITNRKVINRKIEEKRIDILPTGRDVSADMTPAVVIHDPQAIQKGRMSLGMVDIEEINNFTSPSAKKETTICGFPLHVDNNIDTTFLDVVVFIFCFLVMLACAFIIAVLAEDWGMQAVEVMGLVFFWDFVYRGIAIIACLLILFAPFCLCGCSQKNENSGSLSYYGGEHDSVDDDDDDRHLHEKAAKKGRRLSRSSYAEKEDQGRSIEFEAGLLGFSYRDRTVTDVYPDSQAEKLGVTRKMKILAVNEVVVTSDTEAHLEIQHCHRVFTKFKIRFGKAAVWRYLGKKHESSQFIPPVPQRQSSITQAAAVVPTAPARVESKGMKRSSGEAKRETSWNDGGTPHDKEDWDWDTLAQRESRPGDREKEVALFGDSESDRGTNSSARSKGPTTPANALGVAGRDKTPSRNVRKDRQVRSRSPGSSRRAPRATDPVAVMRIGSPVTRRSSADDKRRASNSTASTTKRSSVRSSISTHARASVSSQYSNGRSSIASGTSGRGSVNTEAPLVSKDDDASIPINMALPPRRSSLRPPRHVDIPLEGKTSTTLNRILQPSAMTSSMSSVRRKEINARGSAFVSPAADAADRNTNTTQTHTAP